MARLHVMERSEAQAVMDDLHAAIGRRLAVSSLAPCPVEFTAAFVGMCATQSCGKCTPCRVGLNVLKDLMESVLDGSATEATIDLIEKTARTIYLSSDCAIGYEAGEMALEAVLGFRDDFEHHVRTGACGFEQSQLVPCVSGCPAGVDIPGYISLVEAGELTEAVRLIRKDNPLPLVCGYVCEHPCEARCRRRMIDDAINVRGLKRYAVDHAGDVPNPPCAPDTGKRVAIIGGGPSGLSCAYYLALMGHSVTIFEEKKKLGGMLRYGIPSYRLPRERLDSEINWILSTGIEVQTSAPPSGVTSLWRCAASSTPVYRHRRPQRQQARAPQRGRGGRHLRRGDAPRHRRRSAAGLHRQARGASSAAATWPWTCTRSAVRCGAEKVTIVYRRRVADMTAQDEEIAGAAAEGCELLELHAPLRIESEDGVVCGLCVQPQIIGGLSPRPSARQADAEEERIPCDASSSPSARPSTRQPSRSRACPSSAAHPATDDGSIEGIRRRLCRRRLRHRSGHRHPRHRRGQGSRREYRRLPRLQPHHRQAGRGYPPVTFKVNKCVRPLQDHRARGRRAQARLRGSWRTA